jgi:alpha-tubulin suppressor-like RCC1 family protein
VTGALAIGANGNSEAGHACALFATSASCWGDNTAGQLGNNSTTPAAAPVTVLGLAQPTGIAVGGDHTCASNAPGGVDCWGSTTEGQVGNGTSTGPDSCPNVANACSILPVPVRF